MSVLTAHDLTMTFLGNPVFEGIGFQLAPGDRVGLIGPNGAGKTTLLRVLVGESVPDRGEVSSPKGVEVGYLPQDLQESFEGSILRSALHSVPGRKDLEEEAVALEARLETEEDEDEQIRLGVRLGEVHTELGDLDVRYPPHDAERILTGLGFDADQLEDDVSTLSGGWRMRAALAALLYRKPEVLLLDEPTNHLDIPSVHWLEGFLQAFPGALVLVSHDREFLNRQINRVLSLEPEGLRSYTGDYDAYLAQREEESTILEAQAKNQEQKVREAKRFIDRFRAKASKARQAQSKIKLLEKMDLVETHQSRREIRFSFPPVERAGEVVMKVEGLTKAFDGPPLFRDLELHVSRGDRVAIIGPIGAGKTTLLRIVAGDLPADAGDARPGHNVSLAYYAQHQAEQLNMNLTIVEEVQRSMPGASQTAIRSVCGAFLFSGDAVEKSVGVLSGGEKARVSLAKLLVSRANLMVMDEPTNHLDLHSTEILIDALREYQGSLMFVSHNQSFIRRLATRIWEIRDGVVTEYPGSLDEYYDFLDRRGTTRESGPAKARRKDAPAKAAAPTNEKKKSRKERAEERAERQAKLRPLEKRARDLESRIAKLEERGSELSALLADPATFEDKERSLPLLKEHGEVQKKVDQLMARWEHALEELDAARAELE